MNQIKDSIFSFAVEIIEKEIDIIGMIHEISSETDYPFYAASPNISLYRFFPNWNVRMLFSLFLILLKTWIY